MIDGQDIELLKRIQLDGRRSHAQLGREVGLSTSAVNARLARLKQKGLIERYAACLSPRLLGLDLTAFIQVLIERPEYEPSFTDLVGTLPEVVECHHITGEFSYMLKVVTWNTGRLETILSVLKSIQGMVRTNTAIVLSTTKQTTALPLDSDSPEETGA